MEDDNGLELSLGLFCGGQSCKSKIKDASSDPKVDDGSGRRLVGGNMTVADPSHNNFFQTGVENQDQKGKQKTSPDMEPQESFFTDLGKCSNPTTDHSNNVQNNLSQFNRYQELWASNDTTAGTEEEKSNKRKMPFEEIHFPNKHENVVDYADTHVKNTTSVNLMRSSHISVTEDACSGVNEDVAESEAEGSNSWLTSQHEEKSKSSDILKISDKYAASDSNGIGPQGQKDASVSRRFSSPCAIQPMPVSDSEHPSAHSMNPSSLQLSFGYLPVQLPTLETGSSWAFNSQPRNLTSFISRDGTPNTENSDGTKASHVPVQAHLPSAGNHAGEIGSSSQNEDQSKRTFALARQRDKSNQSVGEGISHEGSLIRAGVASDVKFGGCGSYPNLPWVSTTGPGPNGKTISGVTYKYNQNEVRIVCACHGIHMTPEKFVQHAGADIPNPEDNAVPASFPSSNPAASAKN